jgi:hypothetical protein
MGRMTSCRHTVMALPGTGGSAMNRGSIGLMMLACGVCVPVAAGQVVLHSTLGIVNGQTYDRMDPDMHGGSAYYGSIVDVESADDFTLGSAANLTSVTVDYLTFMGITPRDGVQLNIWSDSAGTPGGLLMSMTAPLLMASSFTDTVYGMVGRRMTLAPLSIPLGAGTYWLTLKPIESSDAYFTVRDSALVNGSPTAGRDIVGNVYGWTNWTTLPYPGLGGTTSMEIVGEIFPAPGTLAGVGVLGVCGLRRRR